jgi:hypothetical protein
LEKKAAYDDFVLPSEVAQYVAKNIFSNVRELEGCLTRLVALSSVNHCTITLEFAHEALRDLIPPEHSKIDIEAVQKVVAVYFNVRLIDLMSKRRTQHLALCRQGAMSEPRTVELWHCGYTARCSGPECRRHATTILRYLDNQGRPDRQLDACDTHASELSAELNVIIGGGAPERVD